MDIGGKDVSVHFNLNDSANWHSACGSQNTNCKTQEQCVFQEIMTQLFKIPTDLVVSSLMEELLFSHPNVKKEVSVHSWARGKLTKLIKVANIKAQLMPTLKLS